MNKIIKNKVYDNFSEESKENCQKWIEISNRILLLHIIDSFLDMQREFVRECNTKRIFENEYSFLDKDMIKESGIFYYVYYAKKISFLDSSIKKKIEDLFDAKIFDNFFCGFTEYSAYNITKIMNRFFCQLDKGSFRENIVKLDLENSLLCCVYALTSENIYLHQPYFPELFKLMKKIENKAILGEKKSYDDWRKRYVS